MFGTDLNHTSVLIVESDFCTVVFTDTAGCDADFMFRVVSKQPQMQFPMDCGAKDLTETPQKETQIKNMCKNNQGASADKGCYGELVLQRAWPCRHSDGTGESTALPQCGNVHVLVQCWLGNKCYIS